MSRRPSIAGLIAEQIFAAMTRGLTAHARIRTISGAKTTKTAKA